MALLNTRIMSYPGNWLRVGLMVFIVFAGIALAGGHITKTAQQETEE